MAARDLGIDQAAVGAVISGRDVIASINSVLLSSLRAAMDYRSAQSISPTAPAARQ